MRERIGEKALDGEADGREVNGCVRGRKQRPEPANNTDLLIVAQLLIGAVCEDDRDESRGLKAARMQEAGRENPTTVWLLPSRLIERPITPGSAAKCSRQNLSLSTRTFALPALSSPGINPRPRATGTPRTEKKLALTAMQRSRRSGRAPMTMFPSHR